MDTKLRSSSDKKGAGIYISIVLLSLLATAILLFYKPIAENAKGFIEISKVSKEKDLNSIKEMEEKAFLEELFKGNYILKWELERQISNTKMNAADVFLKDSGADSAGPSETESSGAEFQENDMSNSVYYEESAVNYDAFASDFTNLMSEWYSNFYNNDPINYQLEYYAVDNETGTYLTNSGNRLAAFLENDKGDEYKKLLNTYSFYTVIQMDKDGKVQIPYFQGVKDNKKDSYLDFNLTQAMIERGWNNAAWYASRVRLPAGMTVVYAVKSEEFLARDYQWQSSVITDQINKEAYERAGVVYLYVLSFLIVAVLGLFLPVIKPLGIGRGIEGRIPLEILTAGIAFSAAVYYEIIPSLINETVCGDLFDLIGNNILPEFQARVLSYLFNVLFWLIIFFVWFASVLSIRELIIKKPLRYIKENTITGWLLHWLSGRVKKLYSYASSFEMSRKDNKKLLLLLGGNMLILILFCSMWGFGIFGVIIYTGILYYLISKYRKKITSDYQMIMEAAGSISDGNLDISIQKDLGVFNPLKKELMEVQKGFKMAVLEETRSQKMKTELITNVSHDLKTPLTAIITYVDLLKDENLTEEQRISYIDTLDRKALRLKILIEDLFEMSKAASNTIILNPVEVDLKALLKQVQFELSDRILSANIDFRVRMPEEKVIVRLDSEKTYRIFENLLINMCKYALPGSRAYLDMELKDKKVFITVRNISQEEIDFTGGEITERFVRGDKARNSEGSGLGLAIAKSFTGLQGGSFQVTTDGDLFKVVVGFEVLP